MTIIYYTDIDGKYKNYHVAPAVSDEELEKLCVEFSKEGRSTAHIYKCEDNSFEAHLFEKSLERKSWDKDVVNEILRLLDDVEDEVNGLL